MSREADLIALLAPVVESMGYVFWGLEYAGRGKHTLLRVYIDKPGAEEFVNVDDCAAVSHQISGIMDVEDPIGTEYRLEVSSPGMDCPLFTLEQFDMMAGHNVKLRLRQAFEKRRKFSGLLKGVEGEDVVVQIGEGESAEELLLPFDWIDKANIEPRFD